MMVIMFCKPLKGLQSVVRVYLRFLQKFFLSITQKIYYV